MLPMLEDLAQELSGKAEIVKFNCNAKNKDLGKSLNIKVAPTFHIYKGSNKVSAIALVCLRTQRAVLQEEERWFRPHFIVVPSSQIPQS